MKKFLIFLAVVFFTCLNAQAHTVVVKYNIAGQPSTITYGAGVTRNAGNFSYNNSVRYVYGMRTSRTYAQPYGQNRFARPSSPTLRKYARPSDRYNKYYPAIAANTPAVTADVPAANRVPGNISRFDKNYQPVKRQGYTRGNITYYN